MARLYGWTVSPNDRSYVFRKRDMRKMKIEKLKKVLKLDEEFLSEVYRMGAWKNHRTDEAKELVRVLRGRFDPYVMTLDDLSKKVVVWMWMPTPHMETGHVKIFWGDGKHQWFPAKKLLDLTDIELLQQITPNCFVTIRKKKEECCKFLFQFEHDLGVRVVDLKEAEERAGDGGYASEEMTENELWGYDW